MAFSLLFYGQFTVIYSTCIAVIGNGIWRRRVLWLWVGDMLNFEVKYRSIHVCNVFFCSRADRFMHQLFIVKKCVVQDLTYVETCYMQFKVVVFCPYQSSVISHYWHTSILHVRLLVHCLRPDISIVNSVYFKCIGSPRAPDKKWSN